jgi:superfamily II DNA/RNA helicase
MIRRVGKRSFSSIVSNFSKLGLRDGLCKAMESLSFTNPTAIQEVAIPRILRNEANAAIASETGGGKTLSYLLPSAEIVRRAEESMGRSLPKRPRAAIVTPSRELAMQVFGDAKALNKAAAADSHFRSTHLLNPGTKKRRKNRDGIMKQSGFDLVVGTPGSFVRYRDSGELYTSKLEVLVLDEADTLLTGGFDKELKSVTNGIGDSCRVVLVGASYAGNVRKAAQRFFPNREFEWIQTRGLHMLPSGATELDVDVKDRGDTKHKVLLEILSSDLDSSSSSSSSILVFCNSMESCRSTEHTLREAGIDVVGLHGGIPPKLRRTNFNLFRDQRCTVMVCTDLAARGLHLDHVGCVVNFDTPRDSQEYLHRAGRTARAGRKGRILNLVHGREKQRVRILRDAATNGSLLELRDVHGEVIKRRERRVQGVKTLEGSRKREREHENAKEKLRSLPKSLQKKIRKT